MATAQTTLPGRFGLWRQVRQILTRAETVSTWSDAEITRTARSLAFRAQAGTPLKDLVVEGFALAVEAIRRRHERRITLFPVQLYAGLNLFDGGLAEMQTGEGKTVTAVAPVFVQALLGRGCHVMTANPYLAERDAETLKPIYRLLGQSVGVVGKDMENPERRQAYACDVTYGTANEFGFDYLRDRLESQGDADDPAFKWLRTGSVARGDVVQRGRHYALIDEADSILLDDGRTPLIIALPGQPDEKFAGLLAWCRDAAQKLIPDKDFVYTPHDRNARLTEHGCQRVVLWGRPGVVAHYDLEAVYHHLEVALRAMYGFRRDLHYMLNADGEISIVDESTGRQLEGRRWQAGLHQAIEIQEGLPPTEEQKAAARITMQRYLRLYPTVAGMTGTAWTDRREFWRLYRLRVRRIPTHRPSLRKGWKTRVFATLAAKQEAVVDAAAELLAQGRAVLVGTPSIRASETLSARFTARGLDHRVLNARQDEEEAHIIELAGQKGRLTIATNMAGRGTDIVPSPEVIAAGGLHVIATEYHSSRRIDRQLVGRAARQGDPGSYQFLVSLEDELFQQAPEKQRQRWRRAAQWESRGELSAVRWLGVFRGVQRRIERRHARDRRKMSHQEKKRWETSLQMGLDPCLDLAEEP